MRKLKYCTNPALSMNTVYSTPTANTPLTNTTTISDVLKLSRIFFQNSFAEKIIKTSCYHSSVLDGQQNVRNLKWVNLNRVQGWDIGCIGGVTGYGKKEGGCFVGCFKGKEGMKIGSLTSKGKVTDPGQKNQIEGEGDKNGYKEYILILAKADADKSGMTKEGTGKPGKELSGAFSDVIKMLKSVGYLHDEDNGNINFV